MRVLWTHNFDPSVPNSGVFMHKAAEAIRARGVDLQLEYLGNLRSVRQLLRARKHVRRLAPGFDLVHAQFGSACALVTSAADSVPKVVTIRGSDWNVHRASRGFFYFHTRLASAFTRLSINSYDVVLTVSRRVAAELQRFAPRAHVDVSPSPVDLSRFVPRDKREARALLGYPGCEEKWVLFNSLRLHNPIKRFALAQQAFDLAQARCGNLRLRIASDLPHEQMPLFVAACDLILCTSDNEGWPNSIKEALACNVPFVATDVSDLRDIASVEPSCRVCPPDAEVIAANICDVLSAPAPQRLRRHVEAMSGDAISDQLIAIYEAALERTRAVRGRVS
ncbi:MAG TPA: glycosyltransferase [Steroidobacter sp.]|uniref:glycosyltransferase n=1 Tax=Steroidobacter sp. TaxID=1978227 RepID=UPI002EDBA3C3